MKKISFIMLAAMLVMLLVPVTISATNGGTNYGFIPNSGEASVSKVDLVTDNAVARYWTAPRYGQLVDAQGNPSGDAFNVPPYAWRASRIEADADGNGWTLNVGSDAFLNCYPSQTVDYSLGYRTYNSTNIEDYGLVGSVVRIQADTENLTSTNNDHSLPLDFGDDEAVQVFPVGEKGDMPRAIAIEEDGDVWIGFYGGKYFQKYEYDGSSLTPVGDNISDNFTPYHASIDKNGILWFSSRNSIPTVAADTGIYYFDTQSPGPPAQIDLGVNPYSILVDNSGEDVVVWATALGSNLYKIDGGVVTTIAISGAAGLRGMSFDDTGIIWIADSRNNAVSWYDPVGGTSGTSSPIESGAVTVGVGKDASGYMWAVCRYDGNDPGFIAKFDPADRLTGLTFTPVDVGYRPYAYDYFITVPEEPTCFDETVWAAQENHGETRFVDQGDWGTYIVYTAGSGNDTDPEIYPLFAGQTHLAGWLHVYDAGGALYVKYIANGDDEDYMEGYSGNWAGLSEYHLHVVDDFDDFDAVRTYNKKTGEYKNPIPGQFQYSMEYEEAVDDTGWIPVGGVDITGFDSEIFIAAHGVMWWCGYPVDVDG